MKPLIKLFGFGVYRMSGVDDLYKRNGMAVRRGRSYMEQFYQVLSKCQRIDFYLSTLKGNRASKNKIERRLKGE